MVLESLVGPEGAGLLNLVIGIGATTLAAKGAIVTTPQQHKRTVERLGKFVGVRSAGLSFKVPLIDSASAPITLKIKQHDVTVETITEDKVSVKLQVSVQYFVIPDKVFEAHYKLQNPEAQLGSYVFDVVRAEVPKMKLDDVFSQKDQIAMAIKDSLTATMDDYGYGIANVLVTDVDPDPRVKAAMNAINENQRMKVANEFKGEADKILIVKAAEASAERKRLSGQGFAWQREEIAKGVEKAAVILKKVMPDLSDEEISEMLFVSQYIDVLERVAVSPNTKLMMFPLDPSAPKDIGTKFREALMVAQEMPNDGEAMKKVKEATVQMKNADKEPEL